MRARCRSRGQLAALIVGHSTGSLTDGGAWRRFRAARSRTCYRRSVAGPNDVERDTGFEPATFGLGRLPGTLPPTILPSQSRHLAVPSRPKTLHVVALEVGLEVGSFSVSAGSAGPAA
jgi:hypothetical protein